ncbi:MAG TPA: prolyl oligopeptidase family serine peptidase [bacterium]|nr:prolyl oligopeptidase family serine peptidase [bacterium]
MTKPAATNTAAPAAPAKLAYPPAKKQDVVDDYHGTKVADPFRGLEDPDSPDSRAWIEAENKLTFDYLAKIPERARLLERLTTLWNYEKYSVPFKVAGRYFWYKNDGLQAQSVLYIADGLDAPPRVLLDPNTLSADGTIALNGLEISDDGKLMAYGLSSGGSDWITWHVREIDTGKDRPDVVEWSKFSGASFTKDGKGFFYSRYPKPTEGQVLEESNTQHSLWYHRLGDPQEKDELVYARPDLKKSLIFGGVSDDGRWLHIGVSQGTGRRNAVYYKDLSKPGSKIVPLIDKWESEYAVFGNDGNVFYVKTDRNAPRSRLIAIDVTKPEEKNWKELVPQTEDTLQSVTLVGDHFFLDYLHDARSRIVVHDLHGKKLSEIPLPGIGTAAGFGGRRADRETFYSYTSHIDPGTIYRYELDSAKSTVFKQVKTPFDPSGYETEQVFFPSKDGTRIPMFLVHKKGLVKNGNTPTYLYGYGGFNVSLTPGYSPAIAMFLEMGGLFAEPNLRGGGEYGEDWHRAGTKEHKQNVFDDFIASAEWLIANKYTSTPKLAIGGGSNGGLLIGAVETQRPDLYGACMPQVGVLDMLRYQKFTIGWAWADDYGTSDDAAMFPVLYKYSPLHNVKAGTKYPPTMITTGDHDDRVVPAHSFKFAAALQEAQGGSAPILIRIETRAGHGAGKPTQKILEEAADRWGFIVKSLGMPLPPK